MILWCIWIHAFDDFIPGTYVAMDSLPSVNGSGGNLTIQVMGALRYTVHDDNGQ